MRAYYSDAYTRIFSAHVIERLEIEGHPAVVLDKTYFYPTGGGQPHDLGTVGGADVLDVQSRKSDNAVVHVLSQGVGDGELDCAVDWVRRFDHMQHHTGQHILSQAFVQLAGVNTVGFHLSPETVTIDLDRADLTESAIASVETLANQILFENRLVSAEVIDPTQAQGVRMRRVPEALATDGLRVVTVADFDQTACGGTHVAHTGEIGLIKVVKVEKRGDKLRIEFRCGGRALRDYRERTRVTTLLGAELTCSLTDVPDAVARLREELKLTQRSLKEAQDTLLGYECTRLLEQAEVDEGVRWIQAAFVDRDGASLRALATLLTQETGVVALLGSSGERSQVVLARSADLGFDMRAVFKALSQIYGDIRGGGQPTLAQGGGGRATSDEVMGVLQRARELAMG